MVQQYSQTPAALNRRQQRLNRSNWNSFRAQFGLPPLRSYGSSYNLTIAQAQAEAATLGIAPPVPASQTIQAAVPQPVRARAQTQASSSDEKKEEDDEHEVLKKEVGTSKRKVSNMGSAWSPANGREPKRAKLLGREDVVQDENQEAIHTKSTISSLYSLANNETDATTAPLGPATEYDDVSTNDGGDDLDMVRRWNAEVTQFVRSGPGPSNWKDLLSMDDRYWRNLLGLTDEVLLSLGGVELEYSKFVDWEIQQENTARQSELYIE